MGIIVNKVSTVEQSAYDWAYIPPRTSNVYYSGFGINRWGKMMDGFTHLYGTTAGGTVKFRFRGRRIGILLGKSSSYGQISFDVDGTDYGTYDPSQTEAGFYNIPVVIATNLPEGEHTLTITKLDANTTSVQGFLVDNAGGVQNFMRTGFNYHDMLDDANAVPKSVGTSTTTITSVDTWSHNITLTNTTASPINVTLQNNVGTTVVGPFPVAANDIRQLTGPIYFAGGMKALASATGITLTTGGQ